MELGIYHEFPVLPGRSQAECFAAGFDIVDASEEYGLDSSSTSTSTAKPGPTPGIPGRRLSIFVAPVSSPKPMRRPRKPTGRR
jgi:hypothetical protein